MMLAAHIDAALPGGDVAVALAMHEVLEAEAGARAACAAAETEAAAIAERGRAQARRIDERVRARAALAREQAARSVAAALAALQSAAVGLDQVDASETTTSARLHAAVQQLAAELSGVNS